MKRLLPLVLCLALLFPTGVLAAEEAQAAEAINLTGQCTIYCNGGMLSTNMRDDSYFTRDVLPAGSVVKVVSPIPIAGVYLRLDQTGANEYPGPWTLEVNGETLECGENGWQQQYVGGFSAMELTMTFPTATGVSDMYFISAGTLPHWVHDWQSEPEKTDVLLMACHSDDDQYTFTGLIPWCLAQDVSIHVAYFINHYTHPNRVHEQLDGLWESGLHIYPTLGLYRDGDEKDGSSREATLQKYIDSGISEAQLVGTQVEVLRRFQPQVVVTHSITGEYGHGAHVLYTDLVLQAIELTGDASQYPESAAEYGVWDVPKVYVHDYAENPVVLDFDTPLDRFGGRTAYNVGQDAFRYELSQTWYAGQMGYMYSQDKAVNVSKYRPCDYGLYRTLVGPDTHPDTLLDNIVLYAEQERLAAEAERLVAEEAEAAAKAEAERLEAEAAARAESESAAVRTATAMEDAEEALRASRATVADSTITDPLVSRYVLLGVLLILALLLIIVLIRILSSAARRRRERERRAERARQARTAAPNSRPTRQPAGNPRTSARTQRRAEGPSASSRSAAARPRGNSQTKRSKGRHEK